MNDLITVFFSFCCAALHHHHFPLHPACPHPPHPLHPPHHPHPHPHARADSTWVVDTNSPPSGRAVGGGGRALHQTPLATVEGSPPGTSFRHAHGEQHRPAWAHAVEPVLGPHARTDCTWNTKVAEPRLAAPEDGRPGEGQRLTPDAPHNGGRPPSPGAALHRPRGTQLPQGMQSEGSVPGPHTRTSTPTACGWRTLTARPEGGRPREGQRLTPEAPHNGGGPAPRGRPPAPRGARPPQGMQAEGTAPDPHTRTPAPTARVDDGPQQPAQRADSRGRGSA